MTAPVWQETIDEQHIDEGTSTRIDVSSWVQDADSIGFQTTYNAPHWLTIVDFELVIENPEVDVDTNFEVGLVAANTDGTTDKTVTLKVYQIPKAPTWVQDIPIHYFREGADGYIELEELVDNFESVNFVRDSAKPDWLSLSSTQLMIENAGTIGTVPVNLEAHNADGFTSGTITLMVFPEYVPSPTVLPASSAHLEHDLADFYVFRQKHQLTVSPLPQQGEIPREIPIRLLWDTDTCPSPLLPNLARAMSVDDEAADFSEDQLRNLIKESLSIHKKKGTVAAVKETIKALNHNFDRIEEGVDGHWAKFRVVMSTPLGISNAKAMKKLIQAAAPLSRHLSSFSYDRVHTYNGEIQSDGEFTHGVIITDTLC